MASRVGDGGRRAMPRAEDRETRQLQAFHHGFEVEQPRVHAEVDRMPV
jgi:hypothetical protein